MSGVCPYLTRVGHSHDPKTGVSMLPRNFHSASRPLSLFSLAPLCPLCLRRGQSAQCLSSWPPATTLSLAPLSPLGLRRGQSVLYEGFSRDFPLSPAVAVPRWVSRQIHSPASSASRRFSYLWPDLSHPLTGGNGTPPSSSAPPVARSCSSQAVGTFRRYPSSCAPTKTQVSGCKVLVQWVNEYLVQLQRDSRLAQQMDWYENVCTPSQVIE